jgi:hypothetical protein
MVLKREYVGFEDDKTVLWDEREVSEKARM